MPASKNEGVFPLAASNSALVKLGDFAAYFVEVSHFTRIGSRRRRACVTAGVAVLRGLLGFLSPSGESLPRELSFQPSSPVGNDSDW
jgi:hypothetical protein